MCKCNFVKFDVHFTWAPIRNILLCYYKWLITSLVLEQCKKECSVLKILEEGFCPLKIFQFPDAFHLKSLINFYYWINFIHSHFPPVQGIISLHQLRHKVEIGFLGNIFGEKCTFRSGVCFSSIHWSYQIIQIFNRVLYIILQEKCNLLKKFGRSYVLWSTPYQGF